MTDPDSALMHRPEAHEHPQAYNGQAVVCADGAQLILATSLTANLVDTLSLTATILSMQRTVGLPQVVLADTRAKSDDVESNVIARRIRIGS